MMIECQLSWRDSPENVWLSFVPQTRRWRTLWTRFCWAGTSTGFRLTKTECARKKRTRSRPRHPSQLPLSHQRQKSRQSIQVLTILPSHAAWNSIKNANAVKQWGGRHWILWTFFLFTETEIIEEFTEPVAVETTEVGLILRVFVLSLDYSFK